MPPSPIMSYHHHGRQSRHPPFSLHPLGLQIPLSLCNFVRQTRPEVLSSWRTFQTGRIGQKDQAPSPQAVNPTFSLARSIPPSHSSSLHSLTPKLVYSYAPIFLGKPGQKMKVMVQYSDRQDKAKKIQVTKTCNSTFQWPICLFFSPLLPSRT